MKREASLQLQNLIYKFIIYKNVFELEKLIFENYYFSNFTKLIISKEKMFGISSNNNFLYC